MTKNEIIIRSKKRLYLHTRGENDSLFSGDGLDFRELREYTSGDDVRYINWSATAKGTTPIVNTFNEAKQMNVVLVYLNSASLGFGSKKNKKSIAVELITALSHAVVSTHDRLMTIFWSDQKQIIHPQTMKKSIADINYDTITKLSTHGADMSWGTLNQYLLGVLKKKSIIVIIGDMLDEINISELAYKHEIYVLILRDIAEERLEISGEHTFVDMRDHRGYELDIDARSIAKYTEMMEKHDEKLYSHFVSHKVRYQKIYTDEDSIEALYRIMR